MVRLTDRPDMTLDVYRGRKTTIQQQQLNIARSLGHQRRLYNSPCLHFRFKTMPLQTASDTYLSVIDDIRLMSLTYMTYFA